MGWLIDLFSWIWGYVRTQSQDQNSTASNSSVFSEGGSVGDSRNGQHQDVDDFRMYEEGQGGLPCKAETNEKEICRIPCDLDQEAPDDELLSTGNVLSHLPPGDTEDSAVQPAPFTHPVSLCNQGSSNEVNIQETSVESVEAGELVSSLGLHSHEQSDNEKGVSMPHPGHPTKSLPTKSNGSPSCTNEDVKSFNNEVVATPKPDSASVVDKGLPKSMLPSSLVSSNIKRRLPSPCEKYEYTLACDACYHQSSEEGYGHCYQETAHSCSRDILLIRPTKTLGENWLQIRPRPGKRAVSSASLCKNIQEAIPCPQTECKMYHSFEEKEFWQLDVQGKFNIKGFIDEQKGCNLINQPGGRMSTKPGGVQSSREKSLKTMISRKTRNLPNEIECVKNASNTQPLSLKGKEDSGKHVCSSRPTNTFNYLPDPYGNYEYTMACCDCCNEILDPPMRYEVEPHDHECKKNFFLVRKTYPLEKTWTKIRARPQKILCFKGRYRLCQLQNAFTRGDACLFPHSEEELEFWEKDRNGEFSIEKFMQRHQPTRSAEGSVRSTAVTARHNRGPYYCNFCSIPCHDKIEWKRHCDTEDHIFNVKTDKEHQWDYRPPPWGVWSGKYRMCER